MVWEYRKIAKGEKVIGVTKLLLRHWLMMLFQWPKFWLYLVLLNLLLPSLKIKWRLSMLLDAWLIHWVPTLGLFSLLDIRLLSTLVRKIWLQDTSIWVMNTSAPALLMQKVSKNIWVNQKNRQKFSPHAQRLVETVRLLTKKLEIKLRETK